MTRPDRSVALIGAILVFLFLAIGVVVVNAQSTGWTGYSNAGVATGQRMVPRAGTSCLERTDPTGSVLDVWAPDGVTDCTSTTTSTSTTVPPSSTTSTTTTTSSTTSTTTTTTTLPPPACAAIAPFTGTKTLLLPTPIDLTKNAITFQVRAANWDTVTAVFEASDADWTFGVGTEYHWELKANNGDWVDVTVTPPMLWQWGNPVWQPVSRLEFSGAVDIRNIGVVPLTAPGAVSVVFDDGWLSTRTEAFPYLEARGIDATLYAIPNSLFDSGPQYGWMNAAQIAEVHAAGWGIAGHSGFDFNTRTDAQIRADVKSTHDWLVAKGYRGRDDYAYANGSNDARIRGIVDDYFKRARTINRTGNTTTYAASLQQASFQVYSYHTAAEVIARIDRAVASGEWLILGFHDLATTVVNSYDYPLAAFKQIVDHIDAINVATPLVSQVSSTVAPVPVCALV